MRCMHILLIHLLIFGLVASRPVWSLAEAEYTSQLIQQLSSDNGSTREHAAKILGIMRCADALQPLITALHDPNSNVRAEAAIALGKLKNIQAVDPLVATMHDEYTFVKGAAATALGGIRGEKALQALLAEMANPTSDIRYQTTVALGHFSDDAAAKALLGAMNDEHADIRAAAMTGLQTSKNSIAVAPLCKAMDDPNAAVRLAAVKTLTAFRSPAMIDTFIVALRDSDAAVRTQAATALGKIKADAAVDPLTICLLDRSSRVRLATIQALGLIGNPRSVAPLITMAELRGDNAYNYRDRSVPTQALRRLGIPALDTLISDAQQTTDRQTRFAAISLLGELQDPRALDVFVNSLTDQENWYQTLDAIGTYPFWADDSILSTLSEKYYPIAFNRPPTRAVQWCHDTRITDALIAKVQTENIKNISWQLMRYHDSKLTQAYQTALQAHPNDPTLLALLGDAGSPVALNYCLAQLSQQKSPEEGDQFYVISRMRDVREITPFLPLLKSDNAEVRKKAVSLLGCLGDARAVAPLIELMQSDQVPEVREYCALALGLVHDAGAVPALINALNDPVEWARSAAAWALGEIGDMRAVVPLQEALKKNDARFNVRVSIALKQLSTTADINRYIELLQDRDRMTRDIAAHSIGEIHDPRIIDALCTVLGSDIKYTALYSLSTQPNPYAVGPLVDFLQSPLNQQNDLDDGSMYELAVAALGNTGDKRAVAPLCEILNSTDDDGIRVAAAAGLAKLGDAHGDAVLLSTLADPGTTEQSAAAQGLAYSHAPQAIDALVTALHGSNPLVAIVAARALAQHGDARGVDALINNLNNQQEPLLRKLIMCYLGECKDRKATPVLLDIAQHGILEEQQDAVQALGMIADADAVPTLLTLAQQDKNPRLLISVAGALGKLQDSRVVTPLSWALKSPYSTVRIAAARSLGFAGKREAVPALQVALNDDATAVRDAAAKSLQILGGN